MARKKQTLKNRFQNISSQPQFLKNQNYRLVGALILLGIGICLSVAFISYLISGSVDQSKLDINWFDLIFNSNIRVENSMGKTGAYLSHLFIYKWFGIASFSVVFILILIALRLINIKILPLGKTIFSTLYYTVLLSVALSFLFVDDQNDTLLYIGGAHGYFISKWLVSVIGNIGTLLLILICFVSIIVVRFNNSIDKLANLFKTKEKKLLQPIQLR